MKQHKSKIFPRNLAVLALAAVLLLGGCGFFSWNEGSDSATGTSDSLLLKTSLSAERDLNFSSNEFSLFISKAVAAAGKELQILSSTDFSGFPREEEFTIISKKYSIALGKGNELLNPLAEIGFSADNSYSQASLFAFSHSDNFGWQIFSPEPEKREGKLIFLTPGFSEWFLAARTNPDPLSPMQAPTLTASPALILSDASGYPADPVFINSSFFIGSNTILVADQYDFHMQFSADKSFKIEIINPYDQSKEVIAELDSEGTYQAVLSLLNDSFVTNSISHNFASASFRLSFSKSKTATLPSVVMVSARAGRRNSLPFVNSIPINLSSQLKPADPTDPPDPPDPPPIIVPALVSSSPKPGSTMVLPASPVTLIFNKTIDQQSFNDSFKILPDPGFASAVKTWNASSTEVVISFPELNGATSYRMIIEAGMKAVDGTSLIQSIEINFSTRENQPPELVEFFPATGENLALNGQLQFKFDESIASSSFKISLIPAAEINLQFSGSVVTVIPTGNWLAATSYEVRLFQGLADVYGNATKTDSVFSFTTSSIEAPSIISFSPANGSSDLSTSPVLQISFDKSMNQNSLLSAITYSSENLGAKQAWNETGTVLTITFEQTLEYNHTYEVVISSSAESETGTKLAGKYFYSFTTLARPKILSAGVFPSDQAGSVASDSVILIPFDRSMQQTKVQQAFSLLDFSGKIIQGIFNWSGNSLSFTPLQALFPGRSYQIIVGPGAVDLADNSIGSEFKSVFSVALNAQATVQAISPANGATGIDFDTPIVVDFTAAVDPDSFAFTIEPIVAGNYFLNWSNENRRVTISFESGLTSATTYSFSLAENIVDSFSRKIAPSNPTGFVTATLILPRLTSSIPVSGSEGFLPNRSIILNFDQSMNRSSVENSLVFSPVLSFNPDFTWSNEDKSVELSFEDPFNFAQTYILTVPSEIESAAGLKLAKTWQISFKTITQTEVGLISPASGAADISRDTPVNITFSAPVEQESAQNAFFAAIDGNTLTGSFNWSENRMQFTPGENYPWEKVIVFGFKNAVLDNNGLEVKLPANQSFSTVAEAAPLITSTIPVEGQTGVAYNSEIQINFSTKMASSTVEYSFQPAISASTESWSSDGKTLTIKGLILSGSTGYSLTLSENSSSSAGKLLAGSRVINFITASVAGPEITQTLPLSGSSEIGVSETVKLRFDRSIKPETFSSAFSVNPAQAFTLDFADTNQEVQITFTGKLSFATLYTLSVSTQLTDSEGLAMNQPFGLSFTTEAAPIVSSVFPADGAQQVATDSSIIFEFNKTMNQTSVQDAFKLTSGFTTSNCTFSWDTPKRLVCLPDQLLPGKTMQIYLGNTAADANGSVLQNPFSASFTTVSPPPFRAEFMQPANGAVNVALDQTIIASFSNPVNIADVQISFLPAPASGYSLNLSANEKQLSIIPNVHLSGSQNYQIKILATSTDRFGSALNSEVSLGFTTVTPTAPEILSTQPQAGSFEVALQQDIVINFSQPMNQASVENAFSILPVVSGTTSYLWSEDNKKLTVDFSTNLIDATAYQVKIAANAADQYGTQLGVNYLLPFQTLTRPELLLEQLSPADTSTQISVQTSITMIFSKIMNLQSVENAFVMASGATAINGSFSQDQEKIVFSPSTPLAFNQTFNLSLNSGAHDLSGNFIKAPANWSFTTSAEQGKVWKIEVAKTSASTMFSSRSDHVMLELNGKLLVIGGFDGSYLNDVWRSEDGINWSPILSASSAEGSSQFAPRAGHACTVYQNKIWLTGGFAETDSGNRYFDDVWSSEDGSVWVKENASADYFQRAWHNLVVFNNQLWIIAGETQDAEGNKVLLDDCWNSSDGASWQQKSQIVSFFPRKRAAAATLSGKLWIWGGYGQNSQGQIQALNDIWNTSNGDLWLLNSSGSAFTPRCGMAQTFFAEKFWLIGGSESDSAGSPLYNDIWNSNDGLNWYQVLSNGPGSSSQFSGVKNFAAAQLFDKMYISGGENSGGYTNEVWSSQ